MLLLTPRPAHQTGRLAADGEVAFDLGVGFWYALETSGPSHLTLTNGEQVIERDVQPRKPLEIAIRTRDARLLLKAGTAEQYDLRRVGTC